MKLTKLIEAAIDKDAIALKEAFSELISEKIHLALEAKVDELQELSKGTLASYIKKVPDSATRTKFQAIAHQKRAMDSGGDTRDMHDVMADKLHSRYNNRVKGASLAVDKLVKEAFSTDHSAFHKGLVDSGMTHEGTDKRRVSSADGVELTHKFSAPSSKLAAVKKHMTSSGFKKENNKNTSPENSFYLHKDYDKGLAIMTHKDDKVSVHHYTYE